MLALISPGSYIAGLSGGRKVVATGGTREQLVSAETNCVGVVVQALPTNSGNVMVGGADVDVTAGSEKGIQLQPGQTVTIAVKDASIIWIDCDLTAEGVSYLLLK